MARGWLLDSMVSAGVREHELVSVDGEGKRERERAHRELNSKWGQYTYSVL